MTGAALGLVVGGVVGVAWTTWVTRGHLSAGWSQAVARTRAAGARGRVRGRIRDGAPHRLVHRRHRRPRTGAHRRRRRLRRRCSCSPAASTGAIESGLSALLAAVRRGGGEGLPRRLGRATRPDRASARRDPSTVRTPRRRRWRFLSMPSRVAAAKAPSASSTAYARRIAELRQGACQRRRRRRRR